MNEYDIKRLALVLAIQAEIEGMKIMNAYRETYDESDFKIKAEELRILAYKHNDNL